MWGVVLMAVLVAACPDSSLDWKFSECRSGTRSAYFYWKDQCADQLPPPIHGLACDLPCDPGSYLSLNLTSQASTCVPCPAGTYSIGGGWRVAGTEGGWKSLNTSFSTYCYTSSYLLWETGVDCTPWTVDATGRYAVSGTILSEDAWLESDLVTFVHLIEPGSLTLRYKKTTKTYNGMPNGVLLIYVNGDRLYHDDSPLDSNWIVAKIDLPAGPSQIIISFEMYSASGYETLSATIDSLEVLGTDYSAKECLVCPTGYSNLGASSCDICPINTYLETTEGVNYCLDCPSGKYAPMGSVGREACLPMQPCTVHDYSPSYSLCIHNTTNRTYHWIQPEICDKTAVSLPGTEDNLPCEACSPGMLYVTKGEMGEMECEWCPEGSALHEGSIGTECHRCESGEYARKVLNYSGFSELPRQMTTYCQVNKETCQLSEGWLPIESALSTGLLTEQGAQLILLRTVNAREGEESTVQFEYTLHGNEGNGSSLGFYVDDVLQVNFTSDISRASSSLFPLSPGHHTLKWIYTHLSSTRAGAYLHWIVLAGVGEGGAPECVSCPAGTFSAAGSSICSICPAGTVSSPDHSKCTPCRWFEYNDIPGNPSGCTICPNYTMASPDHTSCVGKPNITTDEYEYSLRPFTEIGTTGSPLLCDRGRFRHRCQGAFFGPVVEKETYFFLSVERAGEYSHSSYSRLDNLTTGYAFGLIEKKDLPVKEDDLNMPDEVCLADYSKMVVNLGTRIQQISLTSSGFTISYNNGSLCDLQNHTLFSSVLHFHCNKAAGDGWPQLLYRTGCEYHFTWDTRLACHICKREELSLIKGKCVEGKRYSFYEEGESCLYPGTGVLLHMEDCSETEDVVRTWPFLVVLGAAAFLFIVVVVLVYLCCRTKRRYERLIEYREEAAKPSPAVAEEL